MAKGKNIVKTTVRTLTLLLIGAVIICWGIAIPNVLGEDPEKLQNQLVQEAETLIKDGLYVRGAQNYVQAINQYFTKNNEKLEERLLTIYKEGNLLAEYYDLLESRIENKKALVEEYISYGSELVESGSLAKAVTILAQGEELYDDTKLTELYESIKYISSIKEMDSETLSTPGTSWIIPSYDGNKWGFIDSSGDLILDFKYEEAIGFSGNYTVVKEEGTYLVIDRRGNRIAVDKRGLDQITNMVGNLLVGVKDGRYYLFSQYFDLINIEGYENGFEGMYLNDNGLLVVKNNGKWAIFSQNLEPVTEFVYEEVVVNSRNQIFTDSSAVVKDAGGYFVINSEGVGYSEKRFKQMKGLEEGLIAFAQEDGKWGFVNGVGEVIVEPKFEDAFSFSQHLGAVKYAGKWGFINRYGTMIMEAEYESVSPFYRGMSLAKDSQGRYKVITLKYQEVF